MTDWIDPTGFPFPEPKPLTTLHDLLEVWEAEAHADRDDTLVTPSAANTFCRRQLAYRLTLTPTTDTPDTVTVATVGSLLDWAIGRLWEDDPDTIGVQVPVPGGGTADVVQGEPADDDGPPEDLTVRDTKSVSRAKFDRWARNDGPPEEVWDQVMTYAGRLGATHERTTVVIDALCRESGRTATYTRPFDWVQWQAAEEGLANLADKYSTGDPDTAPADREGHGDWVCDSCPWATRCLGEDDRPNVSNLTEDEVADAAAEYLRWNSIANDAAAKAKAARNLLRASTGTFGGWTIAWSERPGRWVEGYEVRPSKVIKITPPKEKP